MSRVREREKAQEKNCFFCLSLNVAPPHLPYVRIQKSKKNLIPRPRGHMERRLAELIPCVRRGARVEQRRRDGLVARARVERRLTVCIACVGVGARRKKGFDETDAPRLKGEIWEKWGATYGRNGWVGKTKKTRIKGEIWEKWGATYGRNGCGGRKQMRSPRMQSARPRTATC